MNVTLKSFSQDVDLINPEKVNYFLIFESGNAILRLPVPKETTEELMKFVYVKAEEGKEEEPKTAFVTGMTTGPVQEFDEEEYKDEDLEAAEEFGGDYEASSEDKEVGYSDEEEIPSL